MDILIFTQGVRAGMPARVKSCLDAWNEDDHNYRIENCDRFVPNPRSGKDALRLAIRDLLTHWGARALIRPVGNGWGIVFERSDGQHLSHSHQYNLKVKGNDVHIEGVEQVEIEGGRIISLWEWEEVQHYYNMRSGEANRAEMVKRARALISATAKGAIELNSDCYWIPDDQKDLVPFYAYVFDGLITTATPTSGDMRAELVRKFSSDAGAKVTKLAEAFSGLGDRAKATRIAELRAEIQNAEAIENAIGSDLSELRKSLDEAARILEAGEDVTILLGADDLEDML